MFLDQIAFQNQCFQFRIRHDILKPGDMRHHLVNLGPPVPARLKILSDTVLQADRLSNINDLVLFPMHQIDSRFPRKFFKFVFNNKCLIFHSHIIPCFLQTIQVILSKESTEKKEASEPIVLKPLHLLLF